MRLKYRTVNASRDTKYERSMKKHLTRFIFQIADLLENTTDVSNVTDRLGDPVSSK